MLNKRRIGKYQKYVKGKIRGLGKTAKIKP